MKPCGSSRIMDPYESFWILMDPHGSLWTHVDPYGSLWILVLLWMLMDSQGPL